MKAVSLIFIVLGALAAQLAMSPELRQERLKPGAGGWTCKFRVTAAGRGRHHR